MKPQVVLKYWLKTDIEIVVHQQLFEYSNVPDAEVTLESNIYKELLITEREKFGLYVDMLEIFQLSIPAYRSQTRDLQSGKEFADWVAFNLEESCRLVDHV